MKKVYVSPTYHGNGWYDPASGINFFKSYGEITVPDGVNTLNIDRYIKLNYLIEVKDEKPAEEPKQVVHKSANQLLSEDIIPEKVEVKVETPVEVIEEKPEEPAKENVEVTEKKPAPKKSQSKKK